MCLCLFGVLSVGRGGRGGSVSDRLGERAPEPDWSDRSAMIDYIVKIPGARLLPLEKVGHQMPPPQV
jgi:hypothetical protein